MIFSWFGRVLHGGHSPFYLDCVYFGPLYPSFIFDMFIVMCVCVCVRVRRVGVVLAFTNIYFSPLCMSVCLGDFFCVWDCVVLNLRVALFPFFVYVCVYMSVSVCVCVCVCVCFQLDAFV